MASYTIPINVFSPVEHIGYSVSVATDIDAGTECTFTPKAKGLSVAINGWITLKCASDSTATRQWFEAGRIHRIDLYSISGVADSVTDAGLNITVYGD